MTKFNKILRSISGWLTFASLIFSLSTPLASAMNLSRTKADPSKQKKNQTAFMPVSQGDKENLKNSLNVQRNGFEENRGQFDESVRFVSRRPDQSVFLTAKEAVFTMPVKDSKKKSFALRMEFGGANKNSTFSGLDAASGKTNYFRGSDANKWESEVSTFAQVKYEEIYKDVDLLWYNNEAGELEYDFIVAPNADYRQIELKFKGAKKLEINKNGDLLVHTKAGILQQRKPFTYQTIDGDRREVASRYKMNGKNKVRFVVGNYDREKELVIDPAVMPYSTFLGGSDDDIGKDIAVDNQGNIYIVGTTRSANFPTNSGAFDTTMTGNFEDVIVSKFNSHGALVYSTFIGGGAGSYAERASGIAVDNSGNAYIVGSTTSTDFPVTGGAFSQTKKGGSSSFDAFVTKLNANGSALHYSTFLGGLADEEGYDIAVDSNGNANVVGKTNSYTTPPTIDSFPVTGNSLVAPNAGGFYTKLNPSGSGLVYSTYLSGSSSDEARKVVTDIADNVYVMGVTTSNNFPTTGGSFDTTHNGNDDIFVSKFSGSTLQYSTYLGGSSYDGINNGFGLAVDNDGNCYVLAPTGSDNFPTTVGALDRTRNNYEAFVAKLNPQGSALVFSTFLSPLNNGPNFGYALAVDSQSNVYVLGETGAQSFSGMDCLYERYVAQIAPDGSAFKSISCYSNTYGDSQAMVIDSAKNLYTAGYSYIDSYPTAGNAFDKIYNGSDDIVFTKHRFINTAINSDFDGDGKSDTSVFRDGTWHIQQSSQGHLSVQFGLPDDIPTPADFDGDGKTDIAVWRAHPTKADFYIFQSSNNTFRTEQFGKAGDDPMAVGDYDGDGKADVAVYRNAAEGQQSYFYFRGSLDNPNSDTTYVPWGTQDDKPAVGDYNGDGKVDFAVFRPSQATWYILNNDSAAPTWRAERFGLATDKLVPADYDGDGKTDVAVFRPSNGTWYIKQSSIPPNYWNVIRYDQWGLGTDTLVPADYDGDGQTDVAVWRDGAWYVKQSRNGASLGTNYGLTNDKPVQSLYVH